MVKIQVEIPDGKYCKDTENGCIFWTYGGSGSITPPFCRRFSEHPERCTEFPYVSSYKLLKCLANRK